MRKKVYIETSVVSYLMSRPSRDLIIAAHIENAGYRAAEICSPDELLEICR
jgi:hypothetical protein